MSEHEPLTAHDVARWFDVPPWLIADVPVPWWYQFAPTRWLHGRITGKWNPHG